MPNNKITITGDLGSGKSSVAKELCKMLGYEYFSTGSIQRELAQKRGMNTLELNYHAEKNKEIDRLIDERLVAINQEKKPYVLDSRLAWHFVKNSFKVYLTVEPGIAAKRVLKDKKRINEPDAKDEAGKALNLLERKSAEDKRFKKNYGVDCADLNNYDVVIDTSRSTAAEVSELIIELFSKWNSGKPFDKFRRAPSGKGSKSAR